MGSKVNNIFAVFTNFEQNEFLTFLVKCLIMDSKYLHFKCDSNALTK